jgi:head-tail adaptor
MNSGDLDTRVEIKRLTKTADGYGGTSATKAVHSTIWAKKVDLSGEFESSNGRRKIYTDIELVVRKKTAETIGQNDLLGLESEEYRILEMFDSKHKYFTTIRATKNG